MRTYARVVSAFAANAVLLSHPEAYAWIDNPIAYVMVLVGLFGGCVFVGDAFGMTTYDFLETCVSVVRISVWLGAGLGVAYFVAHDQLWTFVLAVFVYVLFLLLAVMHGAYDGNVRGA
jgi:hypothetical protein